jgi:EAL domain-containing protein (putative c-di-GMP-specific phosphodiesterase class I)
VDVVKIDRSFVEKMTTDPEVRAIVSAMVDLARSLKIDVVAEGVETEEQRQQLIADGCRLGQGFFFGKPVASADIPNLLLQAVQRKVA